MLAYVGMVYIFNFLFVDLTEILSRDDNIWMVIGDFNQA